MAKVEALSHETHKNIQVITDCDLESGNAYMAAVTFAEEFGVLHARFPLVFQRNEADDTFSSIALMGLEPNENLFLEPMPETQHLHLPLTMRVKPFVIGQDPKNKKQGQVLIDMDSPLICSDGSKGVRLFDDAGAYSEFLKLKIRELEAVYHGRHRADAFIQALLDYDLLEPLTMDLKFEDGETSRLVGFHAINVERLDELSGTVLKKLQDKGYLMPCFLAIASLARLGDLIERKNKKRSANRN